MTTSDNRTDNSGTCLSESGAEYEQNMNQIDLAMTTSSLIAVSWLS